MLQFLLASLFTLSFAADKSPDPYEAVERIDLKNGMRLYLAPSEETNVTSIRVEVAVGWEAETRANWGVSHLLEHVLFRDKELKDEMSYLQLIKENGGSANGMTQARMTSYYGSIPSKKGTWLLEQFSKMILSPEIAEKYVDKEKATVELERGRPSPIVLLLGFNPMDYLKPRYLSAPDFWESEFRVSFDEPYTLTQEQLSTRRLTAQQVKDYYGEYYHPANMRLYISGKFDRKEVMKLVEGKWAQFPARDGKKLKPPQTPNPREERYIRQYVTDGTPYVYLGIKMAGVTIQEFGVLASYAHYVSHRLMKEVRNVKGQTYSANATTYTFERAGYSIIQFQTPKEHLEENLGLVKNYLKTETEETGLTDKQFKEAKELYLNAYALRSRDADAMMRYATDTAGTTEEFGEFKSPYQELANTGLVAYNAILKKYYRPDAGYSVIYRPPVWFHYDYYVIYFFTAAFAFFALRLTLTKRFFNDRVRWVRKIKYPPMKLLEIATLSIGWFLIAHIYAICEILRTQFNVLHSHVLISQYAYSVVNIWAVLLVAQGLMSLIPRKLMVMDNVLIIKSMSYFSKHVPLSLVKSVEARTAWSIYTSPKMWREIKWRFFFFSTWPWKKGLLLRLHTGETYFFEVSSYAKVIAELDQFVGKEAFEDDHLLRAI